MRTGQQSVNDYLSLLSSKAAVPGGGGAAALAGALGVSLASMVGELTAGKKKYAAVEKEVSALIKRTAELRDGFLELADADAEAFLPLSKAYSMPKNTDEEKKLRDEVMQKALAGAAAVPLMILRLCAETAPLFRELEKKGSVLAVSDVGVGALLANAGAKSAALNVFINTKLMKDRNLAEEINGEVFRILESSVPEFEAVYDGVFGKVRN